MHKIEPYISTFEEGLEYVREFEHRRAFFQDAYPQMFGLQGGSIKHPVTLLLTYDIASRRNFGHYTQNPVRRLVVRDGIYRTKYALDEHLYEGSTDSPDEYNSLKKQMCEVCIEFGLRVDATGAEHLVGEYFNFTNVGYRIREHRPSRAIQDAYTLTMLREMVLGEESKDKRAETLLHAVRDMIEKMGLIDGLGEAFVTDVFRERYDQDLQWGGAAHDDEHSPQDWIRIFERIVGEADHAAVIHPTDYRKRLVQIAAVANAAFKSFNRKARLEAEVAMENGLIGWEGNGE